MRLQELIGKSVLILSMLLTISCNNELQNDTSLKLFYNQPASEWTEALPVGNGFLGAMSIFQGIFIMIPGLVKPSILMQAETHGQISLKIYIKKYRIPVSLNEIKYNHNYIHPYLKEHLSY